MAIELESKIDYLSLARELEKPVREAGQAILDIYYQGSAVQIKDDGSPVTKADLASEAILLPAISVAAPSIQIVSEENAISHGFAVTVALAPHYCRICVQMRICEKRYIYIYIYG